MRTERGLIQEEIADLVGVSRAAVGKWEAGKSEPDIETLARLADHYHVSLDYLVGRSDERTPGTIREAPGPYAVQFVNDHYEVYMDDSEEVRIRRAAEQQGMNSVEYLAQLLRRE